MLHGADLCETVQHTGSRNHLFLRFIAQDGFPLTEQNKAILEGLYLQMFSIGLDNKIDREDHPIIRLLDNLGNTRVVSELIFDYWKPNCFPNRNLIPFFNQKAKYWDKNLPKAFF